MNEKINETKSTISERIKRHNELIRSSAALFSAADNVSREEWSLYMKHTEAFKRYPSLAVMGYAPIVHDYEREQHEISVQEEGFPGYNITPGDTRKLYTPVLYYEPFRGEQSRLFGYDMYSDVERREAMERSRDTATPVITNIVNLDNQHDPSYFIYFPIYRPGQTINNQEERRSAVSGYSYAVFLTGTLFKILFPQTDPVYSFKISQQVGDSERDIYKTTNFDELSSEDDSIKNTTAINVDSKIWIIEHVGAANVAGEIISERPSRIVYSGVLASLLLGIFAYFTLLSRSKRLADSEELKIQKAKDDLISLASHQLRTPATGVKQYIAMLMEGYGGKLSAKQEMLASKAFSANERQLTTINEMLNVAKADAGRLIMHKKELNFSQLVRDIIREHKSAVKDNGLILKTAVSRQKIQVDADEGYLRMAIENLINNAMKYTNKGGRVTIRLSEAQKHAILSISDSGVGIAENDRHLVFRKFSRISNSLTSQTNGSGIGLYLSRRIIHLHGGTIDFTSAPDKGTTFIISLPRKVSESKKK